MSNTSANLCRIARKYAEAYNAEFPDSGLLDSEWTATGFQDQTAYSSWLYFHRAVARELAQIRQASSAATGETHAD